MKPSVPLFLRTAFTLVMALAFVVGATGPAFAAPPTAAPPTYSIGLPLQVDSAGGRLYATVQADSAAHHIGVFSTRDGRALASYPYPGPFGLDTVGKRLFVMTAANQVTVLHSETGKVLRAFTVGAAPASAPAPGLLTAAPQYDAKTGQLLVFTGNMMNVVDSGTGKLLQSKAFDVPAEDRCRALNGPLPINRTFFDPDRRLVYLDFVTYSCIPWIGFRVIAYDLTKGAEISRQGSDPYTGLAAGGAFYAMGWYRMGIGTIWAERDGKPADGKPAGRTTGWSSGGPFQLDRARQRLYQSAEGFVRIFNANDVTLAAVAVQPVKGTLSGYDAVTDQVYFVDGATVRPLAATKLRAPTVPAAKMKTLPREPVRQIAVSPAWAKDKTLFALWSAPWPETACYVFGQTGGSLLRSQDGGKQWLRSQAGLGADCSLMSSLAVSPGYAKDRTLLAGVKGNGIFRSTDGGLTWTPWGKGLPHVGITNLALSPAFATDRTGYAADPDNGLQRTKDGGATWQTLKTAANPIVALSPEFDRDGTLAVAGSTQGVAALQISSDRGETWRNMVVPSDKGVRLLSLAPQFARWRVMFAGDGNGDVYRSADGGQTWQRVLQAAVGAAPGTGDRMQIAYGPNEEHREVFLVATGMRNEGEKLVAWGKLYRSADGGQSWVEMNLPAAAGKGVTPTAIAISPAYAQDGVLFVGTAEGEILHIKPGVLQ